MDQNTYVGEVAQLTPASNMHFRNNLILGQRARQAVLAIDTYTNYSSSDFKGRAPDLGAYELGAPPIHYGPRERSSR